VKTTTRKIESKQAAANRRAKVIEYLINSEEGADCEEIARYAGVSPSVVYREIRALRSLTKNSDKALRLVPIVRRDRDDQGKASICVYKWGWGYDKRRPPAKSNLEVVHAYVQRKNAAAPPVENLHAMSSIFAFGQSMTL
jgi:HTH domain